MIIYEITAIVSEELIENYESYMQKTHIPDLLATGYFSDAYFTRAGKNRYRIQYHARDQKALEEYLNHQATRLREDFTKHFSEGIEITRENWEVLQSWKR